MHFNVYNFMILTGRNIYHVLVGEYYRFHMVDTAHGKGRLGTFPQDKGKHKEIKYGDWWTKKIKISWR